MNPFRYRGYYYDAETGFYYCQSRYYDPTIGRFINADGLVSTGQSLLGFNMYSYCLNNPMNMCDPSGMISINSAWDAKLYGGSSCPAVNGPSDIPYAIAWNSGNPAPLPYKSADDAAMGFANNIYSSSLYIRHEYSADIYSRTVKGETTYNYSPSRSGSPHSALVGYPSPKGTVTVAYVHTHPNSNFFSNEDINVAGKLNINAYVVGPNLELQLYSLTSALTTNLGGIFPIALTDAQRASLVTEFQVSWDNHTAAGCNFGCGGITWPTP